MTSAEWSESVDPEPMLSTVLPSASDRKRRLFAVACCRHVEDWLVVESGLVLDERIDDYRAAVGAAERFADGKATSQEMSSAFWSADDSAFCNESVEDATREELRKARFGDDPGWPARVLPQMSAGDRQAMESSPDPAAWLEDEENADNYLSTSIDPFRDVAEADAALVGETIGRQVLLLVRQHGGPEREAEERAYQAALVREIFGDPFPPPAFDPTWRTLDVTTLAAGIGEGREFDRMPILADALEEAGCSDAALLGHCRGPGPHAPGCWVLDRVLGKE